jgi:uncharacterized protein (TIGR02145 family)
MKTSVLTLALAVCCLTNYAQTGTFKDPRNGKMYKTVTIGKQIWFAENLAFKVPSGCWAYDDNEKNIAVYGYLYNWETAKTVCPSGWHLPSDAEWTILTATLGGEVNNAGIDLREVQGSNAGGKMKSTGTKSQGTGLWNSPNSGANNSSGFNAVPAGSRTAGIFYAVGNDALFWSSSEHNWSNAWLRNLYSKYGFVVRYEETKENCFSVRCIKNK